MLLKTLGIRIALATGALIAITIAADASGSRIETTNHTDSAPLNLVNRSYAKLESGLGDMIDSQRLTYRLRSRAVGDTVEQVLKDLILNISGGPSEASLSELDEVSSGDLPAALDTFTRKFAAADGLDRELSGFVSAIKAALARTDVKIFEARIHERERGEDAHFLALVDEETNELLVLSLANLR